jgi:hypothetical protein
VREASSVDAMFKSGEVNLAGSFQHVLNVLPAWAVGLLDRFGLTDLAGIQEVLSSILGRASQLIATQALNVGQATFELVVRLFVMLYLLFFLLRDGEDLFRAIKDAVPLRAEQQRAIFSKFATVIRATVKGTIVVAVLQGALGGLMFWFLGIRAALLWAALMALLSLLPAVGAALVWFPVALYLLATGAVWQGLVLIAYGVLVIGLVDNLLSDSGRHRHQDARLRGADINAGRHRDLRHERYCLGAADRGDVHGCVGYSLGVATRGATRPSRSLKPNRPHDVRKLSESEGKDSPRKEHLETARAPDLASLPWSLAAGGRLVELRAAPRADLRHLRRQAGGDARLVRGRRDAQADRIAHAGAAFLHVTYTHFWAGSCCERGLRKKKGRPASGRTLKQLLSTNGDVLHCAKQQSRLVL